MAGMIRHERISDYCDGRTRICRKVQVVGGDARSRRSGPGLRGAKVAYILEKGDPRGPKPTLARWGLAGRRAAYVNIPHVRQLF
jgi:hypothetical protein